MTTGSQGFWGLGRMVISFQGAEEHLLVFNGSGEQAHRLVDLRSPAKRVKYIYI